MYKDVCHEVAFVLPSLRTAARAQRTRRGRVLGGKGEAGDPANCSRETV
jgi:hypothetical protein